MSYRYYRKPREKRFVMAAVGFFLPVKEKEYIRPEKFERGQVRTVLHVDRDPIRNSYRVLVANRYYHQGAEQWWDADQIPHAIKTLKEAQTAYIKAKWHLEGGAIRRLIRWLF